jgi:hypothetical protein|tara:strand:- start:942 stop:1583 length:642 start_codon:yes stop_codon:yes gene_type:complete
MVNEKEKKLPSMLRQMGMTDTAYWLSWLISHIITNTIMSFLVTGFAAVVQFPQFLLTDYGLIYVTFWLSSLSFTGMAMFMSSLLRNSKVASSAGLALTLFYYFVIPILGGVLYSASDPVVVVLQGIFGWVPLVGPPIHFVVLLSNIINQGTGPTAKGLRWGDRLDNLLPSHVDREGVVTYPSWTLEDSMAWLLYGFFIHFVLAIYLEKIVPNS